MPVTFWGFVSPKGRGIKPSEIKDGKHATWNSIITEMQNDSLLEMSANFGVCKNRCNRLRNQENIDSTNNIIAQWLNFLEPPVPLASIPLLS